MLCYSRAGLVPERVVLGTYHVFRDLSFEIIILNRKKWVFSSLILSGPGLLSAQRLRAEVRGSQAAVVQEGNHCSSDVLLLPHVGKMLFDVAFQAGIVVSGF